MKLSLIKRLAEPLLEIIRDMIGFFLHHILTLNRRSRPYILGHLSLRKVLLPWFPLPKLLFLHVSLCLRRHLDFHHWPIFLMLTTPFRGPFMSVRIILPMHRHFLLIPEPVLHLFCKWETTFHLIILVGLIWFCLFLRRFPVFLAWGISFGGLSWALFGLDWDYFLLIWELKLDKCIGFLGYVLCVVLLLS